MRLKTLFRQVAFGVAMLMAGLVHAQTDTNLHWTQGVGSGALPSWALFDVVGQHNAIVANEGAGGVQINPTAGSGGLRVGAPTGGDLGYGSANFQTLFVNGLPSGTLIVNLQTVNYTLGPTDANNAVIMNGSNLTLTIPANASVGFTPVTIITVINLNSTSLTVAINSDTLTLSGTTTTGSRTVAQNGVLTLLKYGTTAWFGGGPGVT